MKDNKQTKKKKHVPKEEPSNLMTVRLMGRGGSLLYEKLLRERLYKEGFGHINDPLLRNETLGLISSSFCSNVCMFNIIQH